MSFYTFLSYYYSYTIYYLLYYIYLLPYYLSINQYFTLVVSYYFQCLISLPYYFCSKTMLHRYFCIVFQCFLLKNRKKYDNFLQFFLVVYQLVTRNLKK